MLLEPYSRLFRIVALLALLAFIVLLLAGYPRYGGVPIILLFLSLAGICASREKLKSFTYTMVIMAAVCLAMYYPIREVGDVVLTVFIVPLLQIIMFTVGSQISLKDFQGVIKAPKAVGVGLVCQFSIMPLVGFTLAHLFALEPEIAAGLILIGCSASGLASNVMAFLARANLPLSVTLTICATLVAPVMTPLLMKILAGQFVPVDFWAMMSGVIRMVIFPIMAGVLFNAFAYGKVPFRTKLIEIGAFLLAIVAVQLILSVIGGLEGLLSLKNLMTLALFIIVLPIAGGAVLNQLLKGKKDTINRVMAFAAMAGIVVILTIITSAGRDDLMKIGILLFFACLLHNLGGYVLGYWSCRALKFDEKTCRTIALEVGQQNGGLASGIAVEMGKAATVGLAPAVFGALMNVTGSALATHWRGTPIKDENSTNNPTQPKDTR